MSGLGFRVFGFRALGFRVSCRLDPGLQSIVYCIPYGPQTLIPESQVWQLRAVGRDGKHRKPVHSPASPRGVNPFRAFV